MRSITCVLLDGEDEGPCKKLKRFKGPGAQSSHMHFFGGITEKNPQREKFAQMMMKEAALDKIRPKEN